MSLHNDPKPQRRCNRLVSPVSGEPSEAGIPASAKSRREFLKLMSAAAAASVLAPRLWSSEAAPTPRTFQVTANLYAWDLHDEGVDRVLDNLQGMAGINSVYLVGVMHPERRPFGGPDYPHNPVRKSWTAEDGRCYWHPDPKRYGRVKPRLSDHGWLNDTDWLRVLGDAARKRGLKLGVEFSHTLIDCDRMQHELADLAQRDLHGEIAPVGAIKWLRPPCPNHPETRSLALGMTEDVVANHGVDFVQSCIMSFDPAPPEKGGGCFCEHCRRAAKEWGLDLRGVQTTLLANPQSGGALNDWARFREKSVNRFYAMLSEGAHAINPRAEVRYNLHSTWAYARYGINPVQLREHVDSMRLSYYAEQEGTEAEMGKKKEWLAGMQKIIGGGFPLHAPVAMRLKATPDLIREGVRMVVDAGMVGMTASHYDGATFPRLRAIREGLIECGLENARA